MALEPLQEGGGSGEDGECSSSSSFRGFVSDQLVNGAHLIDRPPPLEDGCVGSSHTSHTPSHRWSFGIAPNGGILTSLAISAARQAAGVTHKDPLSVSTHFVRKVGRIDRATHVICTAHPPSRVYHTIQTRLIDHDKARENTPAVLRVRRLAAARSQETLAVSLLQSEGDDGGGGRLELRAQFLMTLGTLARFKVGWASAGLLQTRF